MFDATSQTVTLDLIGCPVRAFGASSGVAEGEIRALFFRYQSLGGFDYATDLLIGPRRDERSADSTPRLSESNGPARLGAGSPPASTIDCSPLDHAPTTTGVLLRWGLELCRAVSSVRSRRAQGDPWLCGPALRPGCRYRKGIATAASIASYGCYYIQRFNYNSRFLSNYSHTKMS